MTKFLSTFLRWLMAALTAYVVVCIIDSISRLFTETPKSEVHISAFPPSIIPTTPYPVGKYIYSGTGYSIDFGEIMMKAKKMSNNNTNPVLVTLTNDAYLTTTLSWLCNTRDMDLHHKLLLVTTDKKTKIAIENFWPHIVVVTFNTDMFSGSLRFGKVGYLRLMLIRTALIAALINENMEVLLFDTDSLWTRNPVPFMKNSSNVDFVLDPVPKTSGKKPVYCPCLLFIYPTKASKDVFEIVVKRFRNVEENKMRIMKDEQGISISEMDQGYISEAINGYKDIRIKVLDYNVFTDGRWYKDSKLHREHPHPIVIQNNYILGIPKKISRAKAHGHWFLQQLDNSCDYDQVQRAVRTPTYAKSRT